MIFEIALLPHSSILQFQTVNDITSLLSLLDKYLTNITNDDLANILHHQDEMDHKLVNIIQLSNNVYEFRNIAL